MTDLTVKNNLDSNLVLLNGKISIAPGATATIPSSLTGHSSVQYAKDRSWVSVLSGAIPVPDDTAPAIEAPVIEAPASVAPLEVKIEEVAPTPPVVGETAETEAPNKTQKSRKSAKKSEDDAAAENAPEGQAE